MVTKISPATTALIFLLIVPIDVPGKKNIQELKVVGRTLHLVVAQALGGHQNKYFEHLSMQLNILGYPVSTLNLANVRPEQLTEYVQMFFMPVPRADDQPINLRYYVSMPLVREDLPTSLKAGTEGINFDQIKSKVVSSEDSENIFETEKKLIAEHAAQAGQLLVPSSEMIKLSMEEVFSK